MLSNLTNRDFPEYCIESLYRSYNVFLENFINCRQDYSFDGIHDTRVSIRRFIAVLGSIEAFFPNQYIKYLKKELKKILKFLNPARDIQVQIVAVEKIFLKNLSILPFLQFLKKKEKQILNNIKLTFSKIDLMNIEGYVFFIKLELKRQDKRSSIKEADIINYYKSAYQLVQSKKEEINPKVWFTLHQYRLALKKYRYTSEFLKPVLLIEDDKFRKMKSLQDVLGYIQDMNVMKELFNEFIKTIDDNEKDNFIPLIDGIINTRTINLINTFNKKSKL